MGRSPVSMGRSWVYRHVRAPMAGSWVRKAYVELGVSLCALLDGAGALLALLGGDGTCARVDARGVAAGDAHGGAGSGESCSTGEGVHFEYVSRRVRGC